MSILAVAWYWDYSVGLRWLIQFMGVMSALYALWDIILDGMMHGKATGSDASEMARIYNEKKGEVSMHVYLINLAANFK